MFAKSKPTLGFKAVTCLVLLAAVAVPPAQGEQGKDDGQRPATKANRQPPETNRIDLGDNLELIERREFRDGKVASLVKTYKRNGETIMVQSTVPLVDQSIFRDYYRDGKEILSEEIDGKGEIIKLYVKAEDGSPSELFERQPDGTTAPVSTKKLEEAKSFFGFVKRTFGPVVDAVEKGDEKAAEKHIDAAIKEVEAARKAASEDSGGASE